MLHAGQFSELWETIKSSAPPSVMFKDEAIFYEEAEAGETSSLVIHHSTTKSIPRSVPIDDIGCRVGRAELAPDPSRWTLGLDLAGQRVGELGAANKFLAQRVADVCQSHDDCCKECDGDSEAEPRQRDLRPSGNLVNGADVIGVKEDEALTLSISDTG